MFFALGVSSTNNLLAQLLYKHLRLEGMSFLFATIKLFLFFGDVQFGFLLLLPLLPLRSGQLPGVFSFLAG